MHPTQGSKSTLGLRDVMGKFGNVNPDAIGLWQSHDQTCDGADGHLSVAPKAGDAVLFYNHHVVSTPYVCPRHIGRDVCFKPLFMSLTGHSANTFARGLMVDLASLTLLRFMEVALC